MASVPQLKAEITQADYFTDEQKKWLLSKIDYALNQLALRAAAKPKEFKMRSPKKATGLMTLEQWEQKQGHNLTAMIDLGEWIRKNKLCPEMIQQLVNEFRADMTGKGKQYANFKAAFINYLAKGWLSKAITLCTLERSIYARQTVIDTKGLKL